MNLWQGMAPTGSLMHTWGLKSSRMVPHKSYSMRAQMAEKVNAGNDRKVSEHTVHHSLQCMGLRRYRLVRVPVLKLKQNLVLNIYSVLMDKVGGADD